MKILIHLCLLLAVIGFCSSSELIRPDFGARLEPTGGLVISGAGQRPEAFKDFYDVIGSNKPVIYMTYMKLNDADNPARFAKLKEELEKYPQTFLIPQIGLSMTGSRKPEEHYEHRVAAGELDVQIDQFCYCLEDCLRVPVNSLFEPSFLLEESIFAHWKPR